MKISEIIHFYNVKELYEKILLKDIVYPRHHIWCYDQMLEKGIEVNNIWTDKKTNTFRFLTMGNILQQIKCIRNSRNSDVIFAPFLFDAYFIALLKCLKCYKKPLVAIAQDTWNVKYASGKLNSLNIKFHRWIARNGVDKLLFISKNVYNKCSDYFDDIKQASPLYHWGVDLNYYDNFLKDNPSVTECFFMTGGSNRDLNIIIQAASIAKDCDILVQTKKLGNINSRNMENLRIDDTPKEESDLLNGYNKALAVLVPLQKDTGSMTGITVVLEGLAFSKPIISTKSDYYPFDLEKEGCGIYVDYGDTKGWVDAMHYIKNHPEEAKEMGRRGRKLLEEQFNYDLFCNEIVRAINDVNKCKN